MNDTSTRTVTPFVCAGVLVAVFAATALASYRSENRNERDKAVRLLKTALAALDATELGFTERSDKYSSGLRDAESVLQRVLIDYPADSASIQRLGVVHWERGLLHGQRDDDTVAALVDLAATRAPRSAIVQADIGTLQYSIGRPNRAVSFMVRALTLSPTMTDRVVATMLDAGLEPKAILAQLPRSPRIVLVLLDRLSPTDPERIDLIESTLDSADWELFSVYFDECKRRNCLQRLVDRLQSISTTSSDPASPMRQLIVARALAELNARREALTEARRVLGIAPPSALLFEQAGRVGLAARDFALAELCFRNALSYEASGEGRPGVLSRLYELLGRSLEGLDRPADAVDAYRHAVRLSAGSDWAASRLAAWGTGPSPGDRGSPN